MSPIRALALPVAAIVLVAAGVVVAGVRIAAAGGAPLAPESIAAVRNAARDRVQVSLNLGYGSAMASIGLTIPTIAVASIWLDGPLELGLEATQLVLLCITVVVSVLTVAQGRAKSQQGLVHLVLLGAFLFLSVVP